ncbi:MAG TPA: fibronectin type III domain-containing protein, partial [Patescibacteria group bacterium]
IVDTQAPSLQSQTHFEGWYNQNQTSTFEYSDTNGAISGTPVSCVISTEGENQTCSVTPNVCDAAGNCNTQTVTSNGAKIDKTLPTSAITTPSNQGSDSTIFTNSWTGNILGTATDSLSGLSKVQITIQNSHEQYWNGEGWQTNQYLLNTQATDESFDTWQYTGLQNPTPDSYTIVSHATDNAGNFENSYKLTVVLDKTIPQVSLSIDPATPDAQNDWYKTQPTVTLSATDTNFDRIEYQWDNQNGSWTTYVNPFTPDSQGAHTLYYRALDKAGNVSDIGIKNISWDNTDLKDGPLNMWVSPNPTSGDTALVKWEAASDNVGIAKYEIRWSLVGSSTSYTDTVGQEIREHTINNLTEGKWNVNVKAIDAAGNWKDSNADLIVDRTSPNAPTLSLAGQGNGSATLSWTKVDDAVDYIIWYGNQPGQHLFGARVGNTTNFTVQGLGAGNYYFSVKSVDQAQNQSSFSNEVNTGNIAGAPGVNPGTPAQGFTPEVKGASTEATPSGTVITVTPSTTPQVLGMDSNRNIKDYWWLLLLIPFTLLWRLLSKKLKSSMP